MGAIAERLAAVRQRIAEACRACGRSDSDVELLAVSKQHPPAAVREALAAGQVLFGENRVQELVDKAAQLADANLSWHMIGSLQTNKVKQLLRVSRMELLHSVDRDKLALALQERLVAHDRQLDVLLEVNATGEEQKHGVTPDAAPRLLDLVQQQPQLRVQGLMAMGPLQGDPRPVFGRVAQLREELRARSGLSLPVLSLGMTDDLEAAIAAGSTLLRIGTAVFGPRE